MLLKNLLQYCHKQNYNCLNIVKCNILYIILVAPCTVLYFANRGVYKSRWMVSFSSYYSGG